MKQIHRHKTDHGVFASPVDARTILVEHLKGAHRVDSIASPWWYRVLPSKVVLLAEVGWSFWLHNNLHALRAAQPKRAA